MSTKQITILLTAVVIAGGIIFASTGLQNSGQNNPITSSNHNAGNAPSFSLPNYDGETVTLAEQTAPLTVVNIWASWCPFCTDELPDFARLQKEYPEKVKVIAINRGESRSQAKSFTDKKGITQDLTFLLDPDESYYQRMGGFAMPETLFVDKNGTILRHHRGPLEFSQMKDIVDKQLQVRQEGTSQGSSLGCEDGQCRANSSSTSKHGN